MTGTPVCASKRRREGFAGFYAIGNVVELAAKVGALLNLGEHLQRAENGQAGADQGKKLLVEDEEWFELDLAARHAAETRARLARKTRGSRHAEAGTQLLGGGRGLHLLLHAAAFIGQLDNELCHRSGCRVLARREAGLPLIAFLFKVNSFAHMIDADFRQAFAGSN